MKDPSLYPQRTVNETNHLWEGPLIYSLRATYFDLWGTNGSIPKWIGTASHLVFHSSPYPSSMLLINGIIEVNACPCPSEDEQPEGTTAAWIWYPRASRQSVDNPPLHSGWRRVAFSQSVSLCPFWRTKLYCPLWWSISWISPRLSKWWLQGILCPSNYGPSVLQEDMWTGCEWNPISSECVCLSVNITHGRHSGRESK